MFHFISANHKNIYHRCKVSLCPKHNIIFHKLTWLSCHALHEIKLNKTNRPSDKKERNAQFEFSDCFTLSNIKNNLLVQASRNNNYCLQFMTANEAIPNFKKMLTHES